MSLKLLEIESEEQFKPIGKLLIDGYEKPFNSFWELLKGDGEEELIDRFWQWHQSTPDSHWTIIKDNEDSVIGAAQWIVHEKSPFEQGNPISPPYWWSDEILKDITDQAMQIFFGRRPATMSRPHLLLNICCVAQSARRKGAGRMMVDWGCKIAHEKGLEAFVEATLDGVRLYESSGFVQVEPFLLDAKLPRHFNDQADAWNKVRSGIFPTPYPVVLMWRPKDGKFVEGQKYSWEV